MLMVSSLAYGQNDTYTYGGQGYEIQVREKAVPAKPVKKKVYRRPAETKPPEPEVADDSGILSLTTAYYKGGIYFGGEKVPADFSFVGVDLLVSNQGWFDFGLGAGYLFNKSAVKVYNGNVYVGYKHKFNEQWTLRAGPQIGLSIYNEKTTIQDVSAFGLYLGAKVQVDYTFKNNLVLGAGLNWRHDMFASSFWGKDPFSDVVLDFLGPQVTLGWKF
jgi:hypothetical protein